MTEHHHDHPIVMIALSICAGMLSWLANPDVWQAIAVAAACGFVGGIARAAGTWAWHKARERGNDTKA